MAKKRKVRSSEADPEAPVAAAPQAPLADQFEPAPPPVEEPQTMAVDESVAETSLVQGGEEEEEPRGQEDGENGDKQQENQAHNGSTSAIENGPEAENNGGEEEDDDEVDEEPLEKLLEPFSKDQLVAILRKAVDKHADLIEEVREIADEDPVHRKIFVHGLGWDTAAETLTSVFAKYGEIEECKHVTDRVSGKSKGYAFILFKHRKGARKALKQPQKRIGNRTTSCQLASTGPVPAPPPSAPPVSEYTQRKIFVSNVSAEVDPGRLLEFFKQFGEIEEGPLGLDKQSGKPKGFALFVYKYTESAKKALEEPHKNFEGRTLYCQRAVDGPKQGKLGYGGAHHQNPHYNPHHHPPRKEKNKYGGGGGSGGAAGHMMTSAGPAVGYNPGAAAAQGLNPVLGQALTALLATQGGGLGFGNYLGGLGSASMNQVGMPAGYGNQPDAGYAMQPGMQGGYQNLPMGGQASMVRPPQGGPPYTGH